MSISAWCNCVYGVELDGEDTQKLLGEWREAAILRACVEAWERDRESDEPMPDNLQELYRDEDIEDDWLDHLSEDIIDALRDKYKAPANADLHYTGDGDLRVGSDDADPDAFLLGFGLQAFTLGSDGPKLLDYDGEKIDPHFINNARWRSWAEAS